MALIVKPTTEESGEGNMTWETSTEVSSPHGGILGEFGEVDKDEMVRKAEKFCRDQIALYQNHLDSMNEWVVNFSDSWDPDGFEDGQR